MTDNSAPEIKSRAMIRQEGQWTCWKFEFDAEDGEGTKWRSGRSSGPHESVENCHNDFVKNGYIIVDWAETPS